METMEDSGERRMHRLWAQFPWLRLAALVLAIVVVAVGPLWTSHLHLLKEFAHIQELARNPNARPDAYTATQWREDKAELRQWTIDQIQIAIGGLRRDMPPREWRNRIRALEREVIRNEPTYSVPSGDTDT